jgi:hypothetical protein
MASAPLAIAQRRSDEAGMGQLGVDAPGALDRHRIGLAG